MDFYSILDQVIALLQRHGRLSYRALTVQFELDDDRLDLLKEELIDIQHIARDQDGRMLVWTGGTEIPPSASASASPPPVQQVITQQDFSTPAASPPETGKRSSSCTRPAGFSTTSSSSNCGLAIRRCMRACNWIQRLLARLACITSGSIKARGRTSTSTGLSFPMFRPKNHSARISIPRT